MMLNIQKIFKNNLGNIAFLILLVILWQSLQVASSINIDGEAETSREIDAIRRASPDIIKPGDIVILTSENPQIRKDIDLLGASIHQFIPTDTNGFQLELTDVLQSYCNSDKDPSEPVYFIWTQDNKQSAMELSNAVRDLNFFFSFQALLPYEGSSAFAIDKLLRLHPKENMIQRYCEVSALSGNNRVMVVIDANDFSPWIGSVNIGRITWLASNPTRKIEKSDFSVEDMPPLIGYDVYWLGVLDNGFVWTYENQDTNAYNQAVDQIKSQNGIVLMDRKATLSDLAGRFVKECDKETVLLESQLFRQMCLK